MTLIVICVLAALAATALRACRRVFAQMLASDWLAHMTEHMREVLEQILSGEVLRRSCAKTRWPDGRRGRWCGYASAPLSAGDAGRKLR